MNHEGHEVHTKKSDLLFLRAPSCPSWLNALCLKIQTSQLSAPARVDTPLPSSPPISA